MTPGQREFRGLTFGPDSDIKLVEEDGLEAHSVRDGDRPIPRDSGSIPGLHLAESKVIVLDLIVRGDTVDATTADLLAAFVPSRETEFQYRFVNLDGVESFIWARPLRAANVRTNDTEHSNYRRVKAALKAADPRIYSVEQLSALVDIFEATGGTGLNSPLNTPLNMTASTEALAVANNAGSRPAYPIIRFQFPSGGSGTCAGVQLENLTNGDLLDIGTTIVAGQTLTADMDALIRATGGAVVHIDGSSRYGDWQTPRNAFRLSPGDNTLKFEVTGTSTDIVCSVQWRNTD